MMGQRHRARVYETPPGFLTADERLVLLVLADETPDYHEDENGNVDYTRPRLEWVHHPEKILPKLGLDPGRDADRKWLARRLKSLDEAGFIQKRKRRRREDGTWMLPSIKLELSAFDLDVVEIGVVQPTERAGKGDPRAQNLDGHRPVDRDDNGRFLSPSTDTSEGTVKDTPEGAVKDTPEGHQWTPPRVTNRTQQDGEQDKKQDSRPQAVDDAASHSPPTVLNDDRLSIEERQEAAKAALRDITVQWSTEESA